jgi:hypothetical protein
MKIVLFEVNKSGLVRTPTTDKIIFITIIAIVPTLINDGKT